MIEVPTGARALYSAAAANQLSRAQVRALSPAIARFCSKAARLGNVFQLSAGGIVVPSTTTTVQPTTTAAQSTTTTAQQTTTAQSTTTTAQATTTTAQPTTTEIVPPPPNRLDHPTVNPGKSTYNLMFNLSFNCADALIPDFHYW